MIIAVLSFTLPLWPSSPSNSLDSCLDLRIALEKSIKDSNFEKVQETLKHIKKQQRLFDLTRLISYAQRALNVSANKIVAAQLCYKETLDEGTKLLRSPNPVQSICRLLMDLSRFKNETLKPLKTQMENAEKVLTYLQTEQYRIWSPK